MLKAYFVCISLILLSCKAETSSSVIQTGTDAKKLKGFLNEKNFEKPENLYEIPAEQLPLLINQIPDFYFESPDDGEVDGDTIEKCIELGLSEHKVKATEYFFSFDASIDVSECAKNLPEKQPDPMHPAISFFSYKQRIRVLATSKDVDFSSYDGLTVDLALALLDDSQEDDEGLFLYQIEDQSTERAKDTKSSYTYDRNVIYSMSKPDGTPCKISNKDGVQTTSFCAVHTINKVSNVKTEHGPNPQANINQYLKIEHDDISAKFGEKFFSKGTFTFTINNWENLEMTRPEGAEFPIWKQKEGSLWNYFKGTEQE